MKRQIKMTTSKKPQKKFLGGALKKVLGSVKNVSAAKADKVAGAAAPAAKEAGSGFKGLIGGRLLGKVADVTASNRSSASVPKAGLADVAASGRSSGRGLKGLIGRVAKAVSAAKKNKKDASAAIPAAGTMGMKKGGAVMKDKMGRAMKKTTADAKGRAMRKGK